jgi:heme exporter protein D
LEDVARHLWRDARLRAMQPDEAAVDWLKPISEVG